MSPLKSSLARSATKIFGVFRDNDLSLRGKESTSKHFDASTDWIRILNQAGPSSGALSFGGVAYDELLVFGVGGGASGAAGSDDDGGGGGAGGAGQFSGYRITGINPAIHTLTQFLVVVRLSLPKVLMETPAEILLLMIPLV